jgi:hypothetical protein
MSPPKIVWKDADWDLVEHEGYRLTRGGKVSNQELGSTVQLVLPSHRRRPINPDWLAELRKRIKAREKEEAKLAHAPQASAPAPDDDAAANEPTATDAINDAPAQPAVVELSAPTVTPRASAADPFPHVPLPPREAPMPTLEQRVDALASVVTTLLDAAKVAVPNVGATSLADQLMDAAADKVVRFATRVLGHPELRKSLREVLLEEAINVVAASAAPSAAPSAPSAPQPTQAAPINGVVPPRAPVEIPAPPAPAAEERPVLRAVPTSKLKDPPPVLVVAGIQPDWMPHILREFKESAELRFWFPEQPASALEAMCKQADEVMFMEYVPQLAKAIVKNNTPRGHWRLISASNGMSGVRAAVRRVLEEKLHVG